ncbi:hypothetical protein HK097_003246 [Rhizophlyctis rosea]|uniref:Uncharacterized protein n=1 Tax=Rhizophlyctis rosea TaxID=64517 RepID=A0AAD5WZP7_9FUNG|nr:hypothetical protein HK097_003246 [Rhizophlyctis rosea]
MSTSASEIQMVTIIIPALNWSLTVLTTELKESKMEYFSSFFSFTEATSDKAPKTITLEPPCPNQILSCLSRGMKNRPFVSHCSAQENSNRFATLNKDLINVPDFTSTIIAFKDLSKIITHLANTPEKITTILVWGRGITENALNKTSPLSLTIDGLPSTSLPFAN